MVVEDVILLKHIFFSMVEIFRQVKVLVALSFHLSEVPALTHAVLDNDHGHDD